MDINPCSIEALREAVRLAFAQSVGEKLLKDYEAAEMLGRSRAKFRQQVRAGELPPPLRDGNMSLWRRSELLAVVERLTAERNAKRAAA